MISIHKQHITLGWNLEQNKKETKLKATMAGCPAPDALFQTDLQLCSSDPCIYGEVMQPILLHYGFGIRLSAIKIGCIIRAVIQMLAALWPQNLFILSEFEQEKDSYLNKDDLQTHYHTS